MFSCFSSWLCFFSPLPSSSLSYWFCSIKVLPAPPFYLHKVCFNDPWRYFKSRCEFTRYYFLITHLCFLCPSYVPAATILKSFVPSAAHQQSPITSIILTFIIIFSIEWPNYVKLTTDFYRKKYFTERVVKKIYHPFCHVYFKEWPDRYFEKWFYSIFTMGESFAGKVR